MNILQFIVYYELIKVNVAAHSQLFLVQLKSIALGEFIPYEWISENINGAHLIREMGSVILIGVGILITTIVLLLLGLLRKNKKMNGVILKIKQKLFFNAFIRYSLQSYLKIGFVSIPTLRIISQRSLIE